MVEIVPADLTNRAHVNGIIAILNSYADKPLSRDVIDRLADGLRNHPTTHILLAVVGGRDAGNVVESDLVGVAICFLGFSTFNAKPLLNLHDLAVLPDYQSRGIGQQLLASVETLARELDCCKVTLEVRESNPYAKALYQRCGFEDFGGITFFMEKRL